MVEPMGRVAELEVVRDVAARLAEAFLAAGQPGPGARLRDAVRFRATPHEELLELRSALVTTRGSWPGVRDQDLSTEAARVLAVAKRLAVEMET